MEKQEKIVSMFNDIAGTYDVANRVLSMGIDKSWRNKACNLAFNFYGKNSIEKILAICSNLIKSPSGLYSFSD